MIALITICLLSVDDGSRSLFTNIGFTLMIAVILLMVYTSVFKSNAYIGMIFVLLLIISGGVFNSLIRKAEYSHLYTLILLMITTNYNITYYNVLWLMSIHFTTFIGVEIINYNSFEGYLWPALSSDDVITYSVFS
jgi:hypothetical protein